MAVPMNTSPQIEQYQCNNQPQPELFVNCLDESRRTDLTLSVFVLPCRTSIASVSSFRGTIMLLAFAFWILSLVVSDRNIDKKAKASRHYWWWYRRRCYDIIVGIVLCCVFRDGSILPRRDSSFVTACFVPGYVSLQRVLKRWNQLVLREYTVVSTEVITRVTYNEYQVLVERVLSTTVVRPIL
jgi:hypothetical protein